MLKQWINSALCGMTLIAGSIMAGNIEVGKLPEDFTIHHIEQRQLKELTVRNGLPNFYAKLQNGAPEVTIAYFGGSITEQNGFRVKSAEYLQKMFPKTKINSVHAAIGGTDSELGAFRLEHDVLSKKPDLVLVEFAVNDYTRNAYHITQSMEGIVRHIWREMPYTDIIFVYTVVARDIAIYTTGKAKPEVSAMEITADYYGIPSIDFGYEITNLVKADKIVMQANKEGMKQVAGEELNMSSGASINGDGKIPVNADGRIPFAADGVHPYEDTGHAIYEATLERCLPEIQQVGAVQTPHTLPPPIVPDCWDKVKTLPMTDSRITASGSWKINSINDPISGNFLKRVDSFCTYKPGTVITLKMKCRKVTLYDIIGPNAGSIIVQIDNNEPRKIVLFDPYCSWYRLALTKIANGLDPNVEHTITITVSDEPVDKRAILFEHNRADFDANPAKYDVLDLYAGCLFVVE